MCFRWAIVLLGLFMGIPQTGMSESSCQEGDLQARLACLSEQVGNSDAMLESIYQDRLEHLPMEDMSDTRVGRVALERAESAWQVFIANQCAFVGGLQGERPPGGVEAALRCYLKASSERIDFLKSLP